MSSLRGRLRRSTGGASGQILPLFAGAIFVLIGVAALAIEVSNVYTIQRFERSVADAASLAAVQDLQPGTARSNPTAKAKERARLTALTRAGEIILRSKPDLSKCRTSSDVVDCAIGPYLVSVATPSLTKATATAKPKAADDPKAIRVTVRRQVGLSFARLFGQKQWNVSITSVAVIRYQKQYAFVTLRPPKPSIGSGDPNEDNIKVSGTGTKVEVIGDVGSNTNLIIDGGAKLLLDADSVVTYHDDYRAWTGNPAGERNPDLIVDPDYFIPTAAGVPAGAIDTAGCATAIAKAKASGYVGYSSVSSTKIVSYDLSTANTTCITPGVWSSDPGQTIGNSQALLLKPGVYFFEGGLTMNGTLIGGYQEATAGVALVFNEVNRTSAGAFKGNSATLISLNAGSCFGSANPAACSGFARPALTRGSNVPVGGDIDGEGYVAPLTLIVKKDPECRVVQPYPTSCGDTANGSLNLAGGGSLYAYGVQYAPTDNVAISGGAKGLGYAGQIISWTVAYSGGSNIQLAYPGTVKNGVIRLDAACSGRGEPCK